MKTELRDCKKCRRKTLQVRQHHQAVHTCDRNVTDFESIRGIECWYCSSCGTLTSTEVTQYMPNEPTVVLPGWKPEPEPGNPGECFEKSLCDAGDWEDITSQCVPTLVKSEKHKGSYVKMMHGQMPVAAMGTSGMRLPYGAKADRCKVVRAKGANLSFSIMRKRP